MLLQRGELQITTAVVVAAVIAGVIVFFLKIAAFWCLWILILFEVCQVAIATLVPFCQQDVMPWELELQSPQCKCNLGSCLTFSQSSTHFSSDTLTKIQLPPACQPSHACVFSTQISSPPPLHFSKNPPLGSFKPLDMDSHSTLLATPLRPSFLNWNLAFPR